MQEFLTAFRKWVSDPMTASVALGVGAYIAVRSIVASHRRIDAVWDELENVHKRLGMRHA